MTVKELKQLLTNDNDVVYINIAGRIVPAIRVTRGIENPYNGQRNMIIIS